MADRRQIVFLSFATLGLIVSAAHAGDDHDHKHHAHEAHVHGAWELFAALDGTQLSVTVKGPIVDVLGFERPPSDTNEWIAVDELQSRLIEPDILFVLSRRADCGLSEPVKITFPEGFSKDLTKEHGESYEPDDHDLHTSDLEIGYTLECARPSQLTEINISGFNSFAAIESIDAVFLGDSTQAANRLGRNTRTLNID